MFRGFMLTLFFHDGSREVVFGQSLASNEDGGRPFLFVNASDVVPHSTLVYDLSTVSSFALYPHTVSRGQLQDGLIISERISSPKRVSNGF